MCRQHQKPSISTTRSGGRNFRLAFTALLLMAYAFPAAAQEKPRKIQELIDSTKEIYSNEHSDYITDGQRVVWVKSYKKWTPDDFETIRKEAPHVLKFLGQAIEHNRIDVLEQLLPDYYRYGGGVEAFVEDIKKAN